MDFVEGPEEQKRQHEMNQAHSGAALGQSILKSFQVFSMLFNAFEAFLKHLSLGLKNVSWS